MRRRIDEFPALVAFEDETNAQRACALAAAAAGYDGTLSAAELDEVYWDTEEAGDMKTSEIFFRRARAAAAAEFLAEGRYDEALFEAAYAFEKPEDLIAALG